jgi:hypothetical protein
MGLLSPQEQEGIVGSAAKAAEMSQRGAIMPSEIALRNAQASHALAQAGVVPGHLANEQLRTTIDQQRANALTLQTSLEAGLQNAKLAEYDARVKRLLAW